MRSGYATTVLMFLLPLVAGCREREVPPPAEISTVGQFDTTHVTIITGTDTMHVRAEIAANEDQRALGLMERRQLGQNEGMLFVYPTMQDSTASFYMFRTRIPLDIAFADSTGTIVSIRSMEPCDSPYPQSCPLYEAGKRFQSALEVNRGYFTQNRVGVGDQIRAPSDIVSR